MISVRGFLRALAAAALAAGCFASVGSAQQAGRPGDAVRAGGSGECVVSRIIDGDTFRCEDGKRVRLLIVDAAEAGQGAWADSAALLLQRIMPAGTRVRLEYDVATKDRYSRLLAYVHSGRVFVNRELARRGLALVAVYPPNVRHVGTIRAAADSARRERRGLWSGSSFACSPADWRAGKCR